MYIQNKILYKKFAQETRIPINLSTFLRKPPSEAVQLSIQYLIKKQYKNINEIICLLIRMLYKRSNKIIPVPVPLLVSSSFPRIQSLWTLHRI